MSPEGPQEPRVYCCRVVNGKPCGKRITRRNALEWCQDCLAKIRWP